MESTKGQALIEGVFVLPILAIIICAVGWFGSVFITQQQLLMAARYGSDLLAYSSLDENSIKREIRNYLTSKNVPGRRLNPDKLTDDKIHIVNNTEKFNPLFEVYEVEETESLFSRDSSFVEISYDLDVPPFLRIGKNSLTITERSEVLTGPCVNNQGISVWALADLVRSLLI